MSAASPTIAHGSFVIERDYPALPARVFAAWADADKKLRWFSCDESWRVEHYALDFRVGGSELLRVRPPGSHAHVMSARYHDIVSGERIVYAYDMRFDETLHSVSLVTVEFMPRARGTRMLFTEHVAFVDGEDRTAEREEGTGVGLDNLQRWLEQAQSS